ncbi:MAG: GxxExxY protein [Gemmatimonadales bacterium]
MLDAISEGKNWQNAELTHTIIAAAIGLHSGIGPGFIEAIYHRGMILALKAFGLECSSEVTVPVYYKGVLLGRHRIDLVAAGTVIVELKSVKHFDDIHFAQVRSYLAASGLEVGLLLNFGGTRLGIRRVYSENQRRSLVGSVHHGFARPPMPGSTPELESPGD